MCFVGFADAQLCNGSLGDPVVNITFGAGANPGPPLSAATTKYQYVTNACPVNGFYTVLNKGIECNYGWHVLQSDHTGNPNGYFMLIDASFEASDFYLDTVKNLCASTTYEFAAWMLNMKYVSQGTRPNITFSIETVTGVVLKTYNSGDIPVEQNITWRQYGFFFTTPANTPAIVLRMTNNAPGGDGNDLALDDITFRPCGPLVNASVKETNNNTLINACAGDTAVYNFTADVSAGYLAPAYQWQISSDSGNTWLDIAGAITNSYKRVPTGAGLYEYRLTVSEAGNIAVTTCRVASNVLAIKVNNKPITTVINDGPKCSGENVTITASGGATYVWNGPNNFTATGQNVIVNNSNASGKYYVHVTSIAGCINTDSAVVNLYDNPVTKFSFAAPACENGIVQFTNASTVAAGQTITAYNWNFGDGNVAATANAEHNFSQAKTYTVTLVTTTDKFCSDTMVQQVTINDLPKPDFVLPEVCLSDAFAAFTNTSSIADNSAAQFTYAWNFGDANATAGNPNTSAQKDPKHTYNITGIYNVQLKVTSKDGCISDTVKAFTVNGALPVAKFVIDNANSLCSNQDITITDNSSVNFGSITKVEIYWDYQNNAANKITDEFPANGKKYSYHYADFGNPATKNFVIKYVAYSGISCVNEAMQTITVKASPQVQFNAMNAVCANAGPFIITAANEINGIGGTGIFSGNAVSDNGLFNPNAAGEGLHNITYTFTATNGCMDAASQTINVFPQPTVNAGPDRTLLEGGFIIIDATANGNNISYSWAPGIAIESNTVLTPKVNPVNDITYTLTVTSADGCASTDNMFVKILKTPQIPNAFSPNADGINDTWLINYLDSYPGVTVQVYNRYGQAVYRSVGYSKPWNGDYNGAPLPVGTYYYIIDRKINAPKLSGWVAILK